MRLTQRVKFRWLFRKLLDQKMGPRFYGQTGFEILGPDARAAAPDLKRIALRSGVRYDQSRQLALEALTLIGADGLPALIEVLEHGDAAGRYMAGSCVLHLNETGVDVRAAVPGLLLADREERQRAVMLAPDPGIFVSSLHYDTPALVSALTNCLWHSNATVRLEATQNLGWLSEKATSAEPALSHAFEDPDASVRDAATDAVHRIVQGILEQDREKIWARERCLCANLLADQPFARNGNGCQRNFACC
jgi:HEAT repeat protein